MHVYNFFYKRTYARTGNATFFMSIRRNSNLKQQCNNVKKDI